MKLRPFQKLQNQFSAHIRHPERHAAPKGLEERRLTIYRELFMTNVEGAIANAFPVLRRLTADAAWAALVRDFYDTHNAHTPLFHQLAKEFLDWFTARAETADEAPFLAELAHYEWVELALSLLEEAVPRQLAADTDLLATPMVKSALAWPLIYAFPVHRIAPDFQPASAPAEPTSLVVYRDAEDVVRFMEINPVTARVLELLEVQPGASGRAVLLTIAAELRHPQPEVVVNEGARLLATLAARGIIGAV